MKKRMGMIATACAAVLVWVGVLFALALYDWIWYALIVGFVVLCLAALAEFLWPDAFRWLNKD
jgi:hypothetical protein